MQLEIIYRDDHLIAINKPYGYFVHKSSFDATSSKIIMKLLRNQIGQFVYPIHRLDRKTTGVLLFALSNEALAEMNKTFQSREVDKEYVAICRGYMDDAGEIDYKLNDKEALTKYETVDKKEIDLPSGKFQTSRYSLVRFFPVTGRTHQIRKHAAHIFHPILADRPHGCNKQNKLWLDTFGLNELTLHARSLTFIHPYSSERIYIKADFSESFTKTANTIGFIL